jgi:hypothetical protein
MSQPKESLEGTRKLMNALLRQPPKPHDLMKLGKKTLKKAGGKRASAKPKKRLAACFVWLIFLRLPIRQALALNTTLASQLMPGFRGEKSW